MDKPQNPIFATRRTNLCRIAKDPETLALLTKYSGDDAFGVPFIYAYLSGSRDITDDEAELLEKLLGQPEGSLSKGPQADPVDASAPVPIERAARNINWPMLERLVDDPPSSAGAVLFGLLLAINHPRADSLAERVISHTRPKGKAA